MKRRAFLAGMGGATAMWPLATHAQRSGMPTVGILVDDSPAVEAFLRLFKESLRELGYVDGQTIRFEFRSDKGQAGRLPELAAELVQLRVDAIMTWFTPAAIAAKQATREIPIVMSGVGDPVATGLIESLSRPGGNVTGISANVGGLQSKALQLVRDVLPAARRVAALVNASNPFSKPFLENIQWAGEALGIAIAATMIRNPEELDAGFLALEKERPDAVIIQPSLPIRRAAQLALKYRLPAVCTFRPFVEEGGLMSYWYEQVELYRRAAAILDKVLKGAKPAYLPVEQPNKFELIINLKTAKALGLTVPPSVLASADEVIE